MKTLVALLLALAVLSGCGSDDGDDGASGATDGDSPRADVYSEATTDDSAQESDDGVYPACDEVWVPGQTVPAAYDGCLDGDTIEGAASFDCTDGTSLQSFRDELWALGDGPIAEKTTPEIAADPAYKAAYDTCVG